MLVASGLQFTRGAFTLKVDPIHVGAGECVGLIGANGTGKTTLLSLLGGELHPQQGEVTVADVALVDFGAWRATVVGLMPDSLRGVRTQTAREHLVLRAAVFPNWDSEYCWKLCSQLSIPLDTPLPSLSKGTQAKLAFVSVESTRPMVLLLDEPTTGLDPVVRREFRMVLRESLDGASSRCIIFSTHLVEDLHDIADRILVLGGGRVVGEFALPPISDAAGRHATLDRAVEALRLPVESAE